MKNIINVKIKELAKQQNLNVEIASIKVKRNNTIYLQDFLLYVTSKQDTFLFCKDIILDVQLLHGIKPEVSFQNLTLHDLKLNFTHATQRQSVGNEKNRRTNLPQKIERFLSFVKYIPEQMKAFNLEFQIGKDSLFTCYSIDTMQIENGKIFGNLTVREQQQQTCWSITGMSHPEKQFYSGELRLNQSITENTKFSLIERRLGVNFFFERLAFSLDILEMKEHQMQFRFGGKIDQCNFFHQGIAEQPIKIDSASFLFNINLNDNKIEVDKNSLLTFNDFSIHPYFLYEKTKDKRLVFSLNEKNMDLKKLITALPKELFQMITRMGLSGKLDLMLLFDCDFADIENLKFDFKWASSGLNIPLSGRKMITKVNQDFKYSCIQDDILYSQIDISPENRKFVKFEDIPFYLKYAILVCEDPSFFRHNGILQKALQESMVTNLKRGKYTRGGSTLSMQFVKNVFLNKKKLITRKLEELLLVWLIEENELISKERMFEIYVNVIEWGPLVYGLYDAADFYFSKTPDMLNFGECVYLATLIRAPKRYYNTIDLEGNLTKNRRSEMLFIAQKMKEREMITEEQHLTFNSFITLHLDTAKIQEWEQWKEEREKEKARELKKARLKN